MTLTGEEFDRAIEDLVHAIPVGQVRSFGQLAEVVGAPRAARRVGRALARLLAADPAAPWHRVVYADGRIPCGPEQIERLRTERVEIRNDRVEVTRWNDPGA